MTKKEKNAIARSMLHWVSEFSYKENGMRTDCEIHGIISGITEGNTLSLEDVMEIDLTKLVDDGVLAIFVDKFAPKVCPCESIAVSEYYAALKRDSDGNSYVDFTITAKLSCD